MTRVARVSLEFETGAWASAPDVATFVSTVIWPCFPSP